MTSEIVSDGYPRYPCHGNAAIKANSIASGMKRTSGGSRHIGTMAAIADQRIVRDGETRRDGGYACRDDDPAAVKQPGDQPALRLALRRLRIEAPLPRSPLRTHRASWASVLLGGQPLGDPLGYRS